MDKTLTEYVSLETASPRNFYYLPDIGETNEWHANARIAIFAKDPSASIICGTPNGSEKDDLTIKKISAIGCIMCWIDENAEEYSKDLIAMLSSKSAEAKKPDSFLEPFNLVVGINSGYKVNDHTKEISVSEHIKNILMQDHADSFPIEDTFETMIIRALNLARVALEKFLIFQSLPERTKRLEAFSKENETFDFASTQA